MSGNKAVQLPCKGLWDRAPAAAAAGARAGTPCACSTGRRVSAPTLEGGAHRESCVPCRRGKRCADGAVHPQEEQQAPGLRPCAGSRASLQALVRGLHRLEAFPPGRVAVRVPAARQAPVRGLQRLLAHRAAVGVGRQLQHRARVRLAHRQRLARRLRAPRVQQRLRPGGRMFLRWRPQHVSTTAVRTPAACMPTLVWRET